MNESTINHPDFQLALHLAAMCVLLEGATTIEEAEEIVAVGDVINERLKESAMSVSTSDMLAYMRSIYLPETVAA